MDPIGLGDRGNLFGRPGQTTKVAIKGWHIGVQDLGSVPAWIYADEKNLHARLLFWWQKLVAPCQVREDCWADIRAAGKSESEQDELSSQAT